MKVLYWLFIGWWFWPFVLMWKHRDKIIASKFWKKWWFWVIFGLFFLIGACNASTTDDSQVYSPEEETNISITETIPIEEVLITEIETNEFTEVIIIQARPVETTTSTSTEPTENISTTTPPNEEIPTEEETTAAPTTAPQKQEIYVYIAQTGSKYHSSKNCRHIKDSVGVVSYLLEVAINMGYTACKTCC